MAKLKRGHGRITLRDVAKEANVSVMTVSNVMRGKDKFVGKRTKEKVLEVIRRLNYRPNSSARGLREARVRSVGLIIADEDRAFLSDPFISQLVSGLSNFLSSREYTLDVQGILPDRFEKAAILKKNGNDALCAILCGPRRLRKTHMGYLTRLGQPVVIFQETFRSPSEEIAVIRQDDRDGGRQLAEHIAPKKPRSVTFLRPALEWAAVEEREKGVRKGFENAGLDVDVVSLIAASEEFNEVKDVVSLHLESNKPDVIMAATDVMGIAAMRSCEEKHLKISDDILVTGYNGFDFWRYARPTLTTVISPAYEMGVHAGKILIDKLENGSYSKRNLVFPVSRQIGEST